MLSNKSARELKSPLLCCCITRRPALFKDDVILLFFWAGGSTSFLTASAMIVLILTFDRLIARLPAEKATLMLLLRINLARIQIACSNLFMLFYPESFRIWQVRSYSTAVRILRSIRSVTGEPDSTEFCLQKSTIQRLATFCARNSRLYGWKVPFFEPREVHQKPCSGERPTQLSLSMSMHT